MRPRPGTLLLLAGLAGFLPAQAQNQSEWVHPGSDGRLVYKTDAKGNRIPDFSNAGYGGGGVPIPAVPVKAVVAPGTGDAGEQIQAAIDSVAKLPPDARGFRGAVLLRRGHYPIAGQLRINAGGVVLRGEGQEPDGTLLIATGTARRSLIVVGAEGGQTAVDDDSGEQSGGRSAALASSPTRSVRRITDDYVPVGARSFHVDDIAGLKVGQEVVVKRPSTAEWIHEIGMDRIPQNRGRTVVQWKPGDKDLNFSRVITRIEGNEVTVDAPTCNALERRFGGGQILLGEPAPFKP